MDQNRKHVYRVEGFSCAGCAGTFEKNVKQIKTVQDAEVNFPAAKITVYGEASIQQLEKAGAFEGLKVRGEDDELPESKKSSSFILNYWNVLLGVFFFTIGVRSVVTFGEEHLASVLSFLLAIIISGYSLFKVGFKNLIHFRFDMKTLMTVAIIGAALIGEWAEGALVVLLFAVSEQLERFSMDKARQSIRSLMGIAPRKAYIRRNQEEMLVHVKDIVVGDTMLVKPGEKLAMDGNVIKGHSSINQAAITGESLPVEKREGDAVYAGTLNTEGYLEVEVSKVVKDTTLAKIIHLVEEAQAKRAPSQSFIDRFAKYYTPAIMVVALLVATFPPLILGASWEMWIYQGLAVLVVGCPCALVISTPVAIVTAIGNAAKQGVLIKGGVYLEEVGRLQAIAFDKTGTLTNGRPVVTDFKNFTDQSDSDVLAKVAAIEAKSQHPLAGAILAKAAEQQVPYKQLEVNDFQAMTGKGVRGEIAGEEIWIGNRQLFEDLHVGIADDEIERIEWLQEKGNTVMIVGNSQRTLALLAVADQVREKSIHVLSRLKELGIQHTFMLTGDHRVTARAIGQELGVDEVKAELMPEDKLTAVQQLRTSYTRVGMVGDGVNDAPALAASNVGFAMGSAGTDTALETADVALMGDDLDKIPYTVSLSRRALTIIKQNIALSLGLKAIALLLVIPGWLTLWIAILADMGATLLVTLNSLRLLKVKK